MLRYGGLEFAVYVMGIADVPDVGHTSAVELLEPGAEDLGSVAKAATRAQSTGLPVLWGDLAKSGPVVLPPVPAGSSPT